MPHLIFLRQVSWATGSQALGDTPQPRAHCSTLPWNVTQKVYVFVLVLFGLISCLEQSRADTVVRASYGTRTNTGTCVGNVSILARFAYPTSAIKRPALPLKPKMHQASSQSEKSPKIKFLTIEKIKYIETELSNIGQRWLQSKTWTRGWYLRAQNQKVHGTVLPREDGQCNGSSLKLSTQHPCETNHDSCQMRP